MDGLLNALESEGCVSSVTLVTDSPVEKSRLELGWSPDFEGNYEHRLLSTEALVVDYIERSPKDAIHVFLGIRHIGCVVNGLKACLRSGRRFGILHEPRVREGVFGGVRYAQSWLTESRLRRKAMFVLAIGAHGPAWFLNTGYSAEKVFPFAYFIDRNTGSVPSSHSNKLRIGYFGRLDREKGIMDFIAASRLVQVPAEFLIAGAGELAEECRKAAATDNRVDFLGALPMKQVQQRLQQVDILVQPSRTTNDGWGVIVSEALLSGCAVIASDVVGSSVCLGENWRGRVIPVGSPSKIASAVSEIKRDGILSDKGRARRSGWADRHLTGAVGARYFLEIMGSLLEGRARPRSYLNERDNIAS